MTTADTGAGSLRLAMQAAQDNNNTPTIDEITFSSNLTGTLNLGSQLPLVDEPLTITGPGASMLSINGQGSNRILRIDPRASQTDPPAVTVPVTISGLTITDGYAYSLGGGAILAWANLNILNSVISNSSTGGIGAGGGGVRSYGPLTVADSTVSGNATAGFAAMGGGVNSSGDTTIDSSVIDHNSTSGDTALGGGLSLYGSPSTSITDSAISSNGTSGPNSDGGGLKSGVVQIHRSTISDNYTTGAGSRAGGVEMQQGGMLSRSTISGNSTSGTGSPGGGLAVFGFGDDQISIEGSTVSGNHTSGPYSDGGGVYAKTVSTTISSSTISGNSTDGTAGYGGGLFGYRVDLTIEGATIAGNSAAAYGGGIYSYDPPDDGADPTLINTITADNSAGIGEPDLSSIDDAFQLGTTLIENPSGATIIDLAPGTNILGVDPQLAPLADNGGPTKTRAILYQTSAVLDAGAAGVAPDQRGAGFQRPVDLPTVPNLIGGDGTDIGAYEAQTLPPPPPPPLSNTPAAVPSFNLKAAIKKCKKKFPKGPKRKKCIRKAKARAGA